MGYKEAEGQPEREESRRRTSRECSKRGGISREKGEWRDSDTGRKRGEGVKKDRSFKMKIRLLTGMGWNEGVAMRFAGLGKSFSFPVLFTNKCWCVNLRRFFLKIL